MKSKKLPAIALLGASGLFGFAPHDSAAASEKPNIILIYSDDHGFADIGAQGVDKDIRTPNLDALVRDGVRFSHGYVSAPQCVPSRAGVITGRYQQRFGVEDNTMGPLPLEELTIAERLKTAGYTSCQVGKWHLEPPPDKKGKAKEDGAKKPKGAAAFLPLAQGFEEYATGQMSDFIASHDLAGKPVANAPQRLRDSRFRCLWQTDAAVSFIDRHPRDPFFLYLAYFAPHVPLESPEPWFSKTPQHLPKERRQALAMIAAMDEGIGKIREKLRSQGIEKNTLIFFIGDNGAPLHPGAWDGSINLPLVGEKGMLTDGGVRTPFVAAWPGTLPAGKTYDAPVINLDVASTAVAIAGLPHDEKLDGVDLVPFLLGEKQGNPHDALFWRWRSQAAVRTDHWKFIMLGDKERYLFNLDGLDGETELGKNNLIEEFPEVAADLEKKLMAWNSGLPTPGLPRPLNAQDALFYDSHVRAGGGNATVPGHQGKAAGQPAADDIYQGWQGRGYKLAVSDGVLHLQPEAGAKKAFITRNNLDLAGPVSATLRLRGPAGGRGEVSWRLQGQADFLAGQSVSFKLDESLDFQEVKVPLSATGKIIHVRVLLDSGSPADIASIEMKGAAETVLTSWSTP